MIVRAVDGNNDWSFGKGLSDYARDNQAIAQDIKARILSWMGDCFFAQQDGIDWLGRLSTGQQDELLQEIRARILQTDGVVSIRSFEAIFDSNTRNYRITFNVETIYSSSFRSTVQVPVGS